MRNGQPVAVAMTNAIKSARRMQVQQPTYCRLQAPARANPTTTGLARLAHVYEINVRVGHCSPSHEISAKQLLPRPTPGLSAQLMRLSIRAGNHHHIAIWVADPDLAMSGCRIHVRFSHDLCPQDT